jgi:hypothetical protein
MGTGMEFELAKLPGTGLLGSSVKSNEDSKSQAQRWFRCRRSRYIDYPVPLRHGLARTYIPSQTHGIRVCLEKAFVKFAPPSVRVTRDPPLGESQC